jgi:hypothetical protein
MQERKKKHKERSTGEVAGVQNKEESGEHHLNFFLREGMHQYLTA